MVELRWGVGQSAARIKVDRRHRATLIVWTGLDLDAPEIISEVCESEVLDIVAIPDICEAGSIALNSKDELMCAVSADIAFVANVFAVFSADAGGVVRVHRLAHHLSD